MSRTDDQFNIRMPPRMRPRIAKMAKANHRSMNAEIVFHLERALEAQAKPATGESLQAKAPAAGHHDTASQAVP